MKKRISVLCLLLAVLILLPVFCACNNEKKDETSTDDTTAETGTVDHLAHIGEFDFGGVEFRVLSVTSTDGTYTQFDTDALGGTVLDDAVYERNREIEERFNVEFYDEYASYGQCNEQLNKQTAAQDTSSTAFDLIMLINRHAYSAAISGKIMSVSSLPHIDQSQDYYLHDINNAMTLKGQQFLCYSDESLYTFQRTTCLAYNKEVAAAYGLPNLYQMVNDGTWTFEQMFQYMQMVTTNDGNGNTTFYGLYGHGDYLFSTFYAAAGQNYVTKNDDTLKFTAISNQLMDTITTQVLNQINLGYMGYSYDYNNPDECYNVFKNGESLFVGTVIGKLLLIKDIAGWDYGVLPYPKYDTEQTRYYSRVVDAWLHVAPAYVKNAECTGVILEALAAGSAHHVFPAFYDVQITGRSIRDPESQQMLEIIRDTRVLDWGSTVFAETIRSEVENEVFVNQKESLSTVCRGIVGVVNALIKEAEAGADALAALSSKNQS